MFNITKVNLRKLIALTRILASSSLLNLGYIKRKFDRQFSEFDYVIDFFIKIHFVRTEGKFLILEQEYKALVNDYRDNTYWKKHFQNVILLNICNKRSFLFDPIKQFIDEFKFVEGNYQFAPKGKQKSAFSGIRNFLLDIDLIYFDKKREAFILADDYTTYFYAPEQFFNFSVERLQELNKRKNALGFKAEQIIMNYENKRLCEYSKLVNKIRYVGNYPLIGYDILSFEANDKNEVYRYIEVKAVSIIDLKFFWSKNEIAKAKSFKNNYYLYLLPVASDDKFMVDELFIIQNPYHHIFEIKSQWRYEQELISVYR